MLHRRGCARQHGCARFTGGMIRRVCPQMPCCHWSFLSACGEAATALATVTASWATSVHPTTSGFTTSHFTWFEQSDVHADISQLSMGALRLTGQRIYTPVCLNMGAAVAVLASPECAQIFLTYRATALSAQAADQLIELILAELECDR